MAADTHQPRQLPRTHTQGEHHPEFASSLQYRDPGGIGYILVNMLLLKILRVLNLNMPGVGRQAAVDHHLVRTQLQGDQENEQDTGKDHGAHSEPGAAPVTPQVAPGQNPGDVHSRGFLRLDRVN